MGPLFRWRRQVNTDLGRQISNITDFLYLCAHTRRAGHKILMNIKVKVTIYETTLEWCWMSKIASPARTQVIKILTAGCATYEYC